MLHAHLVVNNPDLETGLRLSPKLTPKFVNDFATDANSRALDLGWHGFAQNGVSMTLEQMKAAGLSRSRGRYAALAMAEGIEVPEIEGEEAYEFRDKTGRVDKIDDALKDKDGEGDMLFKRRKKVTRDVAGAREDSAIGTSDDLDSIDATSSNNPTGANVGSNEFAVKFKFRDGDERMYVFTRQPTREDIPEKRYREREGFSWKQDIRDRVDVALRLAESSKDFKGDLRSAGCGRLIQRSRRYQVLTPLKPRYAGGQGAHIGQGLFHRLHCHRDLHEGNRAPAARPRPPRPRALHARPGAPCCNARRRRGRA